MFSKMPSVPDPETFTVDPKTGLTNDQLVYILANYGMSMRRYIYNDWFSSTMLKYSKKETDGEFYRRYLETCYGRVVKKV
jgi:hypothetical protein